MATLPDLGMNGLVNSVRRLTGLSENPGYRAVDSAASFIAGCVAKLVADTNGNPYLQVADANDTNLIGLFYCHKTTSFYKPVVNEVQVFGASPNSATIIYLNHANVKTGSVYITSTGATTDAFVPTGGNWTLTATNGYITRDGSGMLSATSSVKVTYLYESADLVGIDQTLGSGMAATLEGPGEVATLVYDTGYAYTLMGSLYANADGYITSNNGGGSVVGKCTKVPTAADPELHFKLSI